MCRESVLGLVGESPMPKPKIYHLTYTLSLGSAGSIVTGSITEEPER